MSTAVATQQQSETVISYVPLGENETISLTLSRVKKFLCTPTKSGKHPSDEQIMKFMMLCRAQSLNPWVNDAYLVGYDGQDGPTFSLITAHQAFLKRAEASNEFNGIESGVVVLRDGATTERQGDMVLPGETLVGGWARVHRRDRAVPTYDALNLKTYDTGRSRWKADPAGMIVKCAEASALRKAFPSTLAAMYCREEMEHRSEGRDVVATAERRRISDLAAPRITVDVEAKQVDKQSAEPVSMSERIATAASAEALDVIASEVTADADKMPPEWATQMRDLIASRQNELAS